MSKLRIISSQNARRLAISVQHLAGTRRPSTLEMIRTLGCVQIDPINTVARSAQLVLWNRLGRYDQAELDQLLFHEHHLFEYWAHAASIVPTEDYPFHAAMMHELQHGSSPRAMRYQKFLADNAALRNSVLQTLTEKGPLPSRLFEDFSPRDKTSRWHTGRMVSLVLDAMWMCGEIMVAGRSGQQKLWDLSSRVLPNWTLNHALGSEELTYQAAQKSLKALGVGTAKQISKHYLQGRYTALPKTLASFEKTELIQKVLIKDDQGELPGGWYMHRDTGPLLDKIEAGEWVPPTVLLSPFDNLICDRDRTEALFNFFFRIEIYVPQAKRQYGYYVLPILHDEQLIGRIDPKMDRQTQTLTIHAVYNEPNAPRSAGKAIANSVARLAEFLDAKSIQYSDKLPTMWKSALRNGS